MVLPKCIVKKIGLYSGHDLMHTVALQWKWKVILPDSYLVLLTQVQNTHDWSIDKPNKADIKKDLTCMIDCVKIQTHLFVFNLATIEPF